MKNSELRLPIVILVLILGISEYFLAYNTYYTEGEVMQGLYYLLVALNIPIVFIAIWKPRVGLWAVLILAALLLPWQAAENRKCAQIHEEVIGLIRHLEDHKKAEGSYPTSIDGYKNKREWTSDHLSYSAKDGEYRISYFMDNAGTGYWYESDTGFDYYPD